MLDINDYFTSEKIKNNSFIYRWNLNTTPTSPVERILIMANLITTCQNQGQKVNLRPDKRIRAKGLYVLFANELNLPE